MKSLKYYEQIYGKGTLALYKWRNDKRPTPFDDYEFVSAIESRGHAYVDLGIAMETFNESWEIIFKMITGYAETWLFGASESEGVNIFPFGLYVTAYNDDPIIKIGNNEYAGQVPKFTRADIVRYKAVYEGDNPAKTSIYRIIGGEVADGYEWNVPLSGGTALNNKNVYVCTSNNQSPSGPSANPGLITIYSIKAQQESGFTEFKPAVHKETQVAGFLNMNTGEFKTNSNTAIGAVLIPIRL